LIHGFAVPYELLTSLRGANAGGSGGSVHGWFDRVTFTARHPEKVRALSLFDLDYRAGNLVVWPIQAPTARIVLGVWCSARLRQLIERELAATYRHAVSLTSTVFSRFCGVAREKFFAFIKVFAMIENSDE